VLGLVASALVLLIRGMYAGQSLQASLATTTIAILVFIAVTLLDVDPVIMIALSALLGLLLYTLRVL